MDMLFLPEAGVSSDVINYDCWLSSEEVELLEPHIVFEEALRDEDGRKILQLAVMYRDDEDAIIEFWHLAKDAEDDGRAWALVSLIIGATYGDACFEMLADA